MAMKLKSMGLASVLIALAVAAFATVTGTMQADGESNTTRLMLFQDENSVNLPEEDRKLVGGSQSTLVRYDGGVYANVHTRKLPPGAYTAWWVIWNSVPEGFDADEDLVPEDVGAPPDWISRGAGGVVDDDGRGHFFMNLPVGDTSEPLYPWTSAAGPGLTDPDDAIVFIVLRYHGTFDPDYMPDQIDTFWGGCTEESVADVHVSGTETIGIYACFEPQAALHVPNG